MERIIDSRDGHPAKASAGLPNMEVLFVIFP
jgi:hypothetical protein